MKKTDKTKSRFVFLLFLSLISIFYILTMTYFEHRIHKPAICKETKKPHDDITHNLAYSLAKALDATVKPPKETSEQLIIIMQLQTAENHSLIFNMINSFLGSYSDGITITNIDIWTKRWYRQSTYFTSFVVFKEYAFEIHYNTWSYQIALIPVYKTIA